MTGTNNALAAVGFKRNRKNGWWYREPSNRYAIQIIPYDDHETHWRIGIARPGGMKWGSKRFANAADAAYRAFEVVDDQTMLDRLTRCPRGMHQGYQDRIKRATENFMKRQQGGA